MTNNIFFRRPFKRYEPSRRLSINYFFPFNGLKSVVIKCFEPTALPEFIKMKSVKSLNPFYPDSYRDKSRSGRRKREYIYYSIVSCLNQDFYDYEIARINQAIIIIHKSYKSWFRQFMIL